MTLILIANVDANNVLSVNGKLANPLEADLRHFRHATWGYSVLVGKNTYNECKDLPGRHWIQLERETSNDVMAYASKSPEVCYLGGGAAVYAAGLRYCQSLLLSRVDLPRVFRPEDKLTYLINDYRSLFKLQSCIQAKGFVIEEWAATDTLLRLQANNFVAEAW